MGILAGGGDNRSDDLGYFDFSGQEIRGVSLAAQGGGARQGRNPSGREGGSLDPDASITGYFFFFWSLSSTGEVFLRMMLDGFPTTSYTRCIS